MFIVLQKQVWLWEENFVQNKKTKQINKQKDISTWTWISPSSYGHNAPRNTVLLPNSNNSTFRSQSGSDDPNSNIDNRDAFVVKFKNCNCQAIKENRV